MPTLEILEPIEDTGDLVDNLYDPDIIPVENNPDTPNDEDNQFIGVIDLEEGGENERVTIEDKVPLSVENEDEESTEEEDW